ncbi:MAG: molybdenum cofactor guanylyltransferase [bacterium]
MKTNKALLSWQNSTIIEHLYSSLNKLFNTVSVVAKDATSYNHLSIRIIPDLYKSYCPLVGILTALKDTKKEFVFIKACDNPLFSKTLVLKMYEKTSHYEIVVPKTSDGYHPLFGFYSKRCLPVVEEMVESGDFRIINLFNKVPTYFFSDDDVLSFDKKMVSLKNINTPQEFSDFKERFEGEDYDKK